MKLAMDLMKEIMKMKFPWNVWVNLLAMLNMVGGIIYISTTVGRVALGVMFGAFVVMLVIYKYRGFVKLLGLGHIIFFPPLVIIAFREWMRIPGGSMYAGWLIAVVVLNSISLIIDCADVFRYALKNAEE